MDHPTDSDQPADEDHPPVHGQAPEGGADLVRFWETARGRAGLGRLDAVTGSSIASVLMPPAWSFGATAEQADDLLALVLAGTKTATASALASYQVEGERVPTTGDLAILLDGAGRPRALIRNVGVAIVGFDEVGPEHAAAEGEGDGSLEHWRTAHRRFLAEELGAEVTGDLPVVLERFELLYPRAGDATGSADPSSS